MPYDFNIREGEIIKKVSNDFFSKYDTTQQVGDIDFCVSVKHYGMIETQSLLWAEAKKGSSDIYNSFVQLVFTIGKARTFDKHLPPPLLAALDAEKIAFIAYNDVHEVFYQNDFNWNVAPSNHQTKEFQQVLGMVKDILEKNTFIFKYDSDEAELKKFIKTNFVEGKFGITKNRIDKNNFIAIYSKWLKAVKPYIAVDWNIAKKSGIIDGDFYLADLLSMENVTLRKKLFVVLKNNKYELDRQIDEAGMFSSKSATFTDGQKAHNKFWKIYERPPKEEYWDYIIRRRNLLVPQDIRERKGSFFTPQIWVEKSQAYLANALGEDWQEEYTIWDCAAGTGNLLHGLTKKYNIWASTLDKQDVEVMKSRIRNGANLLEDQVFQFDFLNDDFSKLPEPLQKIINDPKKRKKLIIYINPPYAEASNKKTLKSGVQGNRGVEQTKTNKKYAQKLGQGNAELFVQFLTRIYFEIPDCIIAHFSTLKIVSGPHFIDFRNFFHANHLKSFICPANTFDNVKGQFPIGFMIWDTSKKEPLKKIRIRVYDKNGKKIETKSFYSYDDDDYINQWVKPFRADPKKNQLIGKFPFKGNDFQNQNMIQIVHHKMDYNTEAGQFLINQQNIKQACVYFAVRKCIKKTWINDRDQFLSPKKKWEKDTEFQNDCLAYTLFTNNIQSEYGTNHWIPFSETEVNARTKFESDFMVRYMNGKINTHTTANLFEKINKKIEQKPLIFSDEAKQVFDAGKELWEYYHAQPKCNVNASLYDIRAYFQGRKQNGRMNSTSNDPKYTNLIGKLREKLNILAEKIEPKIYEYGFLKS